MTKEEKNSKLRKLRNERKNNNKKIENLREQRIAIVDEFKKDVYDELKKINDEVQNLACEREKLIMRYYHGTDIEVNLLGYSITYNGVTRSINDISIWGGYESGSECWYIEIEDRTDIDDPITYFYYTSQKDYQRDKTSLNNIGRYYRRNIERIQMESNIIENEINKFHNNHLIINSSEINNSFKNKISEIDEKIKYYENKNEEITRNIGKLVCTKIDE